MLCWNGLNPRSQVILIFSNETEIVEPLKWLRENHILHSKIKLEDNDDTVVYLRDIIEKTKISIQEFWDIPVGNDEWIKNNINEIKTPIFIKQNDVSIFSPKGTEFYEFLQMGFNQDLLSENLLLS